MHVPLLRARELSYAYAGEADARLACDAVSLELDAGEVLAIVGESGSGKTTLLRCLAGQLTPLRGRVELGASADGVPVEPVDLFGVDEPRRRSLMRTVFGVVHQHAHEGLRMNVSAGGNIVERPLGGGRRRYASLRELAEHWLRQVEIDPARIDDRPTAFSGGMRQRLQIARVLVSEPALVYMDEPTGGLDVSVQARLLDLLRSLVRELRLAVVVVTHDLAVARLLADRMMVMRDGRVVEQGLTDQVLDDPQHPYTQSLVSAVLIP